MIYVLKVNVIETLIGIKKSTYVHNKLIINKWQFSKYCCKYCCFRVNIFVSYSIMRINYVSIKNNET